MLWFDFYNSLHLFIISVNFTTFTNKKLSLDIIMSFAKLKWDDYS